MRGTFFTLLVVDIFNVLPEEMVKSDTITVYDSLGRIQSQCGHLGLVSMGKNVNTFEPAPPFNMIDG